MKNKKIKTFAKIFTAIVLVLLLTGLAFQLGIRYYIGVKVQEEMTEQIEQYEKWLVGQNADSYVQPDYEAEIETYSLLPRDFTQLVSITLLCIPEGDGEKDYDSHEYIIDYCFDNLQMTKELAYRELKVEDRTHYLMLRKYNRLYETLEGVDISYKYTAIFMASPDKLYDFAEKIQIIFVLVMLVLGVVLFVTSYNIGMRFQKDKLKLTRYFQNASHELKTPIMSIQGYAEGISTGVLHDNKKAADVIMTESDRMSNLVEEILILSKIDTGSAGLNNAKEPINISDLICDCLNRIYEQAESRNIDIKVNIENENLQISGNEIQLERVFFNIISNALRYAKSTIEVGIFTEKKWIRIEIFNDGDGISDDDLPHIFERFYKGNGGQHGIGLSITQEIILLHKGKIKACNKVGACFNVWLKRKV